MPMPWTSPGKPCVISLTTVCYFGRKNGSPTWRTTGSRPLPLARSDETTAVEPARDGRVSALLPAAGQGTRLGLGPKAWLTCNDRPLIAWVAEKLSRIADEVIVAVPAGDVGRARDHLQPMVPQVRVIAGADTHQNTIHALLHEAREPLSLLHVVARPFASQRLLAAVADEAFRHGAALSVLPTEVPAVRLGADGTIGQHFRANDVGVFQSPQAFATERLLELFEQARMQNRQRQTAGEIWLEAGLPVCWVAGEKTNIKITTAEDWRFAQALTEYLER